MKFPHFFSWSTWTLREQSWPWEDVFLFKHMWSRQFIATSAEVTPNGSRLKGSLQSKQIPSWRKFPDMAIQLKRTSQTPKSSAAIGPPQPKGVPKEWETCWTAWGATPKGPSCKEGCWEASGPIGNCEGKQEGRGWFDCRTKEDSPKKPEHRRSPTLASQNALVHFWTRISG